MSIKSLWVGVVCLGLLSAVCSISAQSTTDQALDQGVKAYQAYHTSDIDAVNLQNGNVTVKIPLFSLPQRGGQYVSYSLLYNAKQMKPKTQCVGATGDQCTDFMLMQPDLNSPLGFSLRDNFPGAAAIATDYSKEFYFSCTLPLPITQCPSINTVRHTLSFASRSISDSTGARHPLALASTGIWRTADGSGYQLRSLDNQGDTETILPDGAVAFFGVGETSGCSSTDANGNELCTQDTIGRPWTFQFYPYAGTTPDASYCTGSLTTTATSTISVPTISGGFATYKACYATINVVSAYNVDEGTATSSIDVPVMQSLVLPDNTAWGFSYDTGTGNLTKVTYPTGASISYSWSPSLGSPCSLVADVNGALATRSIDANDGKGPQTWSYAWTATGGYNWSVDVTDPLQNDTVTQFLPVSVGAGCSYFPQVVTSYQGPASNNQVLKTVTTQYTSPANAPNYMGVLGVYPTSVTTSEGGVTSQVQMDYDSGFTATTEDVTSGSGTPYTVPYGKVLAKREYDFGNGQPGALLRTTNTQYMAFANSTYLSDNFMNLVYSKTILDGSGVQQAQTTYGYDESSPVGSGITNNLTTAPWGSIRGNLTSIHTWMNGAALITTPNCTPQVQNGYLVTTKTYFDTGEVSQTTDACGQSASYGYDPAYAGAYQTSVANALGTTYKSYDFNTGLPLTDTDLNGQITSYQYVDPLARITSITTPDSFQGTSGGATFTYNYNANPLSVLVAEKLSNSYTKQIVATVDGMGKLLTTDLMNDPDGATYVTHGYDALGRENATGNPMHCQPGSGTCTEPTAGTMQHIFDALGRETQTVPQDGSTTGTNNVSTTYSGNVVVVTDQVGVSLQRNYDALGRLKQVIETNPGWMTNYSYDILGNLTCVEQQGGVSGSGCAANSSQDATSPWRVRRFTYDGLSRLLTAKNPESGQTPTTYTYDANGNVITKTDGRGITITYSYDQVGRLTGKTYSNGDPAVSYTYDAHSGTNFGIGRRTGMTDGSGSTTWTYDNMGRVSSETRTIGTATHTSSTSYYLNGSPYQITYPSGNVVTYDIHEAGRPQTVSDAATTYASALTYWPAGMLKTGTLGAGIGLSDSYNSRLQPSVLQASTSSATLMSLGYDFGINVNDNGNLNHLTNYKDTTRNLTFAYDTRNRLKLAHGDQSTPATHAVGTVNIVGFVSIRCNSLPGGCDTGLVMVTVGTITESVPYGAGSTFNTVASNLATQFTNDPNSPVTGSAMAGVLTLTTRSTGSAMNTYLLSASSASNGGGTSAFSTSTPGSFTGGADAGIAPGQLNEAYVVDAWGNMMSSGTYNAPQPLAPGVDNRFTAYTYDGSGNLLSDGTSAGFCGSGAQYGWNAESQITCYGSYAYTYDGDGGRVAKSSSTLYWSGGLAESDLSGNITSEYIFLAGKRIARRDIPSGAVYYYLSDNLGSSNVVTDSAGNIQNESDFYPFGIENALTSNLGNQHFKYTAKERDSESGLDYFGARYYRSSMGRFMSPDWAAKPEAVPYSSLGNPQSLNLYAYVGNNPMSLVDADGHSSDGSGCGSWICDASEELEHGGTGGSIELSAQQQNAVENEGKEEQRNQDAQPKQPAQQQGQQAPTNPDGSPKAPPVDPPRGADGQKNSWVQKPPSGNGGRDEAWESEFPTNRTPGGKGSKAGASWDPGDPSKGIPGHWDVDTGYGGPRGHYLPDGTQVDHWGNPGRPTAGLPNSKKESFGDKLRRWFPLRNLIDTIL